MGEIGQIFFKSGGIFRTNINRAAGGSLVVPGGFLKFKFKKEKKWKKEIFRMQEILLF